MNEEEFLLKFGDDDLEYEEFYYEDSSGIEQDITIEAHE
jgi:hypothetical protein|tara:strand:+ start:297 stop:413 length:117 start_codon:yes stop_codon:yes gene_type:complete